MNYSLWIKKEEKNEHLVNQSTARWKKTHWTCIVSETKQTWNMQIQVSIQMRFERSRILR